MAGESSHSHAPAIEMRLKHLIEANQNLADVESLNDLIPKLLHLARNVTNAEASSLFLYDPKEKVLGFSYLQDEILADERKSFLKKTIKLKLGEGIAGWVAQSRKGVIVRNVRKDPRFTNHVDRISGFTTQSLVCVPVLHGEELLGVVEVLNARGRPFFDDSDREILSSLANLAAVALVRAKLLEERLMREKLRIEMETANRIQSLFWPKVPKIGGGSHIWGISIPAGFVGGDLYDWIPLPDGSWLIYIADVSDKGLPAALVMAALWSRIRSCASMDIRVGTLLGAVNIAMCDLLAEEGFFATILMGRYYPKSGRLILASGGHLPPLMISEGRIVQLEDARGVSLGIWPDTQYHELEIILAPNDSIVFLTDGVTEACNLNQELFGTERLLHFTDLTEGPPWGPVLVRSIKRYSRGTAAADDLTVVEIWRERHNTES
jgi:serine phosphatase RsbU (regulator of sigma subunit)